MNIIVKNYSLVDILCEQLVMWKFKLQRSEGQ
jgi:hypothetical protein